MLCPRCRAINADDAPRCACGYSFVVSPPELDGWFGEVRQILENAYLTAPTPWQQSGKSGTFEDWTRLRIPVAECVDRSGTFLDIGCANGFLLECLLEWTRHNGVAIEPFGLDYSEPLAVLARRRLPQFARNIFTGNAWDWRPPAWVKSALESTIRSPRGGLGSTLANSARVAQAPAAFDFVRTEAVFVPRNLQRAYLTRLLTELVAPGGHLLVAHYRSRSEDTTQGWLDEDLAAWGFAVERVTRGFNGDGRELTRVAAITKQ